MARPVTVLTVDDQPVFLRAASELIAATPGFEHVAEARSGARALELVPELHPDLVLLDVRMPDMDGVETAHRMLEMDPDMCVILISLEEAPDLPPWLPVTHVRKQSLSARTLRELWNRRR